MATILIVEDDANQLEEFDHTFQSAGWKTLLATTGSSALLSLHQQRADVVLADLRLPDMSAIALLTQCRTAAIVAPFLIMTAFASVADAVASFKAGASDFLEKPIPVDDLLRITACTAPVQGPSLAADELLAQSISDRRVSQALTLIDTRWSDHSIVQSEVAAKLGVSRYYFARLMKEHTGHSFMYLLHARRVREGADLLANSDLTIKEIAWKVGYDTAHRFSRNFRHFYRDTPQSWRTRPHNDTQL